MRHGFAASFGPFEPEVGLRSPRTDVTDTGTAYKVVAEVPREKLDVRARGTVVEIRAESGTDTEEKDEQYLRRERAYAGYYRALELPEPVVAARFVNGLLELELPKLNPTPSDEPVKVSVT